MLSTIIEATIYLVHFSNNAGPSVTGELLVWIPSSKLDKWMMGHSLNNNNNNRFNVLRPFVWDYPGEPVPEETLAHPPSWSSNLYQLLPSTTIHSILPVQITCLAIFLHNLSPCPLWSTSWPGALHLIFHTFLHPISVFFSQHMPIPSQPVLLQYQYYIIYS